MRYLTPENFVFLIALALFMRAIWFLLNAGNKPEVSIPEPQGIDISVIQFTTSLDQTPGSIADLCRQTPLPDISDEIHYRQMRTYFKYQHSLIAALVLVCIGVSIPIIKPYATALITKTFFSG